MGSSENDDSEMGYQYRGEMSSGSMFNNKSSSGGSGNLFGPGWDPLENFGTYPLMNQYQSAGELVPKMMVNPSASPNSNSNNSSREKRRLNPNMVCEKNRILIIFECL